MNDERIDNPFDQITRTIGVDRLRISEAEMPPVRDLPWPKPDLRQPPEKPREVVGTVIKNDDVPRAGELSSQVFNDLTTRIITELQETVESQINDTANRRIHAKAQMESLTAEIDKAFGDYEVMAKRHQQKVNELAAAVKKKVEADTQEMIALSKRLRDFADSVNNAHEKFFEAPEK